VCLSRQSCAGRGDVGTDSRLHRNDCDARHHATHQGQRREANRGGKVVLHGDSYDDAYKHAMGIVEQEGEATFVHPYDDPDVIAGQGTIGMEILRQHSQADRSDFCADRRRRAAAGIAAYVKRLKPEIKVIGVEPTDSDAMYPVAASR
jgi:threonine dehydratase